VSYERREYRDLLEQRAKAATKANQRGMQQAAQAAVPMDMLTHSEEWDYFLSQLQESVENIDKVLEGLHGASVSDPSFDPTDLARHKAMILQAATQKATLEQVLRLPKQILEKAENAKLALERLGDE